MFVREVPYVISESKAVLVRLYYERLQVGIQLVPVGIASSRDSHNKLLLGLRGGGLNVVHRESHFIAKVFERVREGSLIRDIAIVERRGGHGFLGRGDFPEDTTLEELGSIRANHGAA